jgi:hypothetical protein
VRGFGTCWAGLLCSPVPRGSIGRRVARAAASGGSHAYRGRAPIGWYASLVGIGLAGFGLIAYSRYEVNHPTTTTTTTTTTIGPGLTSQWFVGLAFDQCGKVSSLPATSTKAKDAGIKVITQYILEIAPDSVPNAQDFVGNNATLKQFVTYNEPHFTLTNTTLQLPGKGNHLLTNGDTCAGKPGKLVFKVWPTPSSPTGTVVNNLLSQKLQNGSMITVAFVPDNATSQAAIPSIPSTSANSLEQLYETSVAEASTTTTLPTGTAPTSSTVVGPTEPATTSTTVKGSTSTTTPSSSTTSTTAANSTTTTVPSTTTST